MCVCVCGGVGGGGMRTALPFQRRGWGGDRRGGIIGRRDRRGGGGGRDREHFLANGDGDGE